MKKIILLAFLLMAGFSLFAQTSMPSPPVNPARIYVQPVTGADRPEDNAFFYKQLEFEVAFQRHLLQGNRRRSDYIFLGKIERYTGVEQIRHINLAANEEPSLLPESPTPSVRNRSGKREYFSWEAVSENFQADRNVIYFYDSTGDDNDLHYFTLAANEDLQPEEGKSIFSLELIERKTGKIIDRQYILFFAAHPSMAELLSAITFGMLSNIPHEGEEPEQVIIVEEDVRERTIRPYGSLDNWLFFEYSLLYAPQFNYGSGETLSWDLNTDNVNWLNLGVNFALEFHFLRFMAIEAGVQFIQETSGGVENRDLILEIPAALKIVLKPFNLFMIELYGGISYNLSLMDTIAPSSFSYFAGLQFGFKAGSGLFVIDPRVSIDLDNSLLGTAPDTIRYLAQIGIGYKFGLFRKGGE